MMDNAVPDLLESLPSKTNVAKTVGDDGVVTLSMISLMVIERTMDEIATLIIMMKKEEIDIPPMDKRSNGVVEVVEVEGAEGGEDEEIGGNSNSNLANGHQHHPWILGRPISPVAIRMKIRCV